ncbi:unnamed protein product [Prunus armeniaca]|uniref:Uncharacterized protein n=1 Tax=Prunus armeniaca TaxID=36596 RepID=A0A6J5VI52_PRUAR|nr:unnamed protein product [Prunus armeniaca]
MVSMVGGAKANAILSGAIHLLSAGTSDFIENYYMNPLLRLSNRGGRGRRGRQRGGRINRNAAVQRGEAEFWSKTNNNLCEVVVSPSKELEEMERKRKAKGVEDTVPLQGYGGWPKTATRES